MISNEALKIILGHYTTECFEFKDEDVKNVEIIKVEIKEEKILLTRGVVNMEVKMKIHNRLEGITNRCWFTLLILILIFLPPYSTKTIQPEQSANVVLAVFAEALIYRIPKLFPLFKAIPLLLFLFLILYRNKVRKVFSIYVTLIFFLVAIFQNMAYTQEYGFTVLTGNLLVSLFVSLAWFWEAIADLNDFSFSRLKIGQVFMMLLAFFAFWYPINMQTLAPDFKLRYLLTSGAGLTFCMLVPVYLTVLFAIYPRVNMVTLKVTSLVGFITGILTVIQFFIINPAYWWMGILHLPLLFSSLYGLVLAKKALPSDQSIPDNGDLKNKPFGAKVHPNDRRKT